MSEGEELSELIDVILVIAYSSSSTVEQDVLLSKEITFLVDFSQNTIILLPYTLQSLLEIGLVCEVSTFVEERE